ncbi:hypothetical protein EDWATA_00028 [Edwardsiella tarda ATCC 23685]|uniref:Uncharacterized protein n=1 Tax=Edwardsiella tarda ATCC 23685 TaxID=500638 RepID=D4F009_EDWTA|nr:hypothetical protein EDWATA_00028 [Edwardsiella tarda ATCC 23685]
MGLFLFLFLSFLTVSYRLDLTYTRRISSPAMIYPRFVADNRVD